MKALSGFEGNFRLDTFVWDADVPNLNTFASISHERQSDDIDVNEDALERENEHHSSVINIDINENDEVETVRPNMENISSEHIEVNELGQVNEDDIAINIDSNQSEDDMAVNIDSN
ncbi:hypothetical protein H6P81_010381 [Aristolochia fimbriata]|uniref:Uncharacterized protein n=1 Tax=Aristolochia fimbriata TaxID=158543 RepID=A0AAV7ERH2_ARIFI|nr:hypothetical protein H6P81_010381 [Aristolochia fimbriata]